MSVGSLVGWGAGTVVICAALVIGWRYHRWKQRQRQRLQSESRLLETSQGTVEYQMEGEGPVVLVLHGGPGGYDQGMAWAHVLPLRGYTLLALSRPGYRRTPLSSGQTPEAQAQLYAATLDALHEPHAVIIALSGGGPSALQFALRFPHRCRGLLLISALTASYSEAAVYRSLPFGQRLLRRLFDHLLVWDPCLYLLSGLSKHLPQEAQSSAFLDALVMNPLHSDGYRNDTQQFATLPAVPFQDIGVPTLIVHGTADVDVPFRQLEALANALPHAQLVAVEGANHFSVPAGPPIAAIRRFLEALPPGENSQTSGRHAHMHDEAR